MHEGVRAAAAQQRVTWSRIAHLDGFERCVRERDLKGFFCLLTVPMQFSVAHARTKRVGIHQLQIHIRRTLKL